MHLENSQLWLIRKIASWWALFSKIKFSISLGAQCTERSNLDRKWHLLPPTQDLPLRAAGTCRGS